MLRRRRRSDTSRGAGWVKWREIAGIVCDTKMPIILKAVVRYVLMYGCETWALRKAEQVSLERIEVRMLRCMMGIKRIENIISGENK